MNKLEYRIDSKIIKQLSLYLLLHGVRDFNLDFHSNSKDVTFVLKVTSIKQETLDKMQEKLSRQREIEVEVYGWELLGDTDSQNELDILGSLIDYIEIKKHDDFTEIIMKRTYRYKE